MIDPYMGNQISIKINSSQSSCHLGRTQIPQYFPQIERSRVYNRFPQIIFFPWSWKQQLIVPKQPPQYAKNSRIWQLARLRKGRYLFFYLKDWEIWDYLNASNIFLLLTNFFPKMVVIPLLLSLRNEEDEKWGTTKGREGERERDKWKMQAGWEIQRLV